MARAMDVHHCLPFVLQQAWELFFAKEHEATGGQRTILEKIENFAEEIVPRFTGGQFKSHFRLDLVTFENLINQLHGGMEQNELGRPCTPVEKQAMITLWCLANQECFRSVADRFGVAKSTAWECLHRICTALLNISQIHGIISWPTGQRALDIIERHERKSSFPGVIGSIDGSHIPIKAPKDNPNSYVCRKGFTSLLLQAVCDDRYLFTDCYAGEAGSIHDACLFRRSDLASDILDGTNEFPNDSHLLGDGAYTLTTKLLVPFRNNGHLSDRQKNYNICLSSSRATIEQAFAHLKGRFRRLKYLETTRMDLACLLIMASCILHNICILEGDNIPGDVNLPLEIVEERRQNHAGVAELAVDPDMQGMRPGAIKRNQIVNTLPMRIIH